MKKIISMLLLVLFILMIFAGCSSPNKKTEEQLKEEIRKELEAEMAAKKPTDASTDKPKPAKVDMKNMDALYELVKKDIKDLSRDDFNSWKVNYLDITGDGTDEAVFESIRGVEWPQKMQIISGDSGEYKLIPSDIPLYKYENKPELRDGFFVVTGRTGGTGTASTLMNLYVYDGSIIISVLPELEVFYRVTGAPVDNSVDIERTGEIDGKLTDFVYTVTELDKVTGKTTIKKKEQYIYNANTKSFDIKPMMVQTDDSKNSAPGNNQEAKTIDAADLKVGDKIDGHTINKLIYKKGEEFGIWLNGEFTITGELSYDDVFWGDMILSTDMESALPTKIKFMFDEEYSFTPPLGTFVFDDNGLNVLKSKIGSSLFTEIENGKKVKVKAVIKDYGHYAKSHTSPGWGCSIIDVVMLDGNSGNQSSTSQSSAGEKKTLYLADLKNGDDIGGGLTIKDIDYKKGGDRASFTLEGSTTVTGQFFNDPMGGTIAFQATDNSTMPFAIVIEGPNNESFEYTPHYFFFRNEEVISKFLSSSDLKNIENDKPVNVNVTVKDFSFSFKFGSEGGTSCELIKIN